MNLPTPTPVKISILNPILNEPIPTPIEMLFATLLNLIQKKKKKNLSQEPVPKPITYVLFIESMNNT